MRSTEDYGPIKIPRGPADYPVDYDFSISDTVFSHGCDISVMKRKISELQKTIKHMQTAMLVMATYMLLWMFGWGFGWW